MYAVAVISWAALAASYALEMQRYSPWAGTSWLTRVAVAFITACQITKLRLAVGAWHRLEQMHSGVAWRLKGWLVARAAGSFLWPCHGRWK